MGSILVTWLIYAAGFLAIAALLPGVHLRSWSSAFGVAAVYGLLNFLLYRLLVLVAFIPIILTLGLFLIVINAFIIYLTDKLFDDFEIDGFGYTMLAAVLFSAVTWVMKAVLY